LLLCFMGWDSSKILCS
jgi:hypothetical protein